MGRQADLQPGDVLLDTSTLHEAYIVGRNPELLAFGQTGLAQLVEAIALHERIFVVDDLFSSDDHAQFVASHLDGLVHAIPVSSEHRVAMQVSLERLLGEINPSIVPPGFDVPEGPRTGAVPGEVNEFGLLDIWDRLEDFTFETARSSRSFGARPRGVDVRSHTARHVSRALLYYLVSVTFDIAYSPNDNRAPYLFYVTRVLGPGRRSPAQYALGKVQALNSEASSLLEAAIGVPLVGFKVPLFLSLALEKASTLEDVLANALEVRSLPPVAALRQWARQVESAIRSGRVAEAAAMLARLQAEADEFLGHADSSDAVSLGLALPPSISIGVDVSSLRRSPVWFLRDLVDYSLRVGSLRIGA